MSSRNRYGLSLADPDGLERWRADGKAREQQLRRERRQDSIAQLRDDVQAEFVSLRSEMTAQQEIQSQAIGQCFGEFADEAANCTERAVQRVQSELWSTIERRFAELNARLDLLVGKARAEKFREESPVQDLPNPLSRRGLN